MMIIDDCPTCGKKLRDTGGGVYYYCEYCQCHWLIEDLEFESIQKKMDEWLK